MRVHLQVDGDPAKVSESIRQIADAGADGLFSFEGPHDVLFPLLVAARESELALMTNVAIAGPRSAVHLAHAAYDLQVYSGGRFRLGLGTQIRPHIEKRYGATWGRPAARIAETVRAVKAVFDAWEGNAPLNFRGEFVTHTLMPPTFNPGPNPFGPPPISQIVSFLPFQQRVMRPPITSTTMTEPSAMTTGPSGNASPSAITSIALSRCVSPLQAYIMAHVEQARSEKICCMLEASNGLP